MWNLQHIVFFWRRRYCQISKSALVYLLCRAVAIYIYQLKLKLGCSIFSFLSVWTCWHLIFRVLVKFKIEQTFVCSINVSGYCYECIINWSFEFIGKEFYISFCYYLGILLKCFSDVGQCIIARTQRRI